jgi:hypothetical protein
MGNVTILPPNEWENWARYFGIMYPTSSEDFIYEMCARMIRTLAYCSKPHRLTKREYLDRLTKFRDALKDVEKYG